MGCQFPLYGAVFYASGIRTEEGLRAASRVMDFSGPFLM